MTQLMEMETCPSCAADGGYGHAIEGQQYRCPECRVIWSPWPDAPAVRTSFGNWIQRCKVWITSSHTRERGR